MIEIFNTRTRTVEPFKPACSDHATLYVCGPTVYDTPHIGNMRPCIVFDVLFRLLKQEYPKVTYVHNITDIDDKIIARAHDLNISPQALAQSVEKTYKQYLKTFNILEPTRMPRATEHIEQMIKIISTLIERKNAYVVAGNVLFHVPTYKDYGKLAHKNTNELLENVRIDNLTGKQHPADFVLWKPAKPSEPYWDSPWGHGRPGWHIECSAMIHEHLGLTIDIHGGGIDLVFPHHENEIAQSVCYTHESCLARYFMHNGHVHVDNTKMSKTLQNIIRVDALCAEYSPEVIRLALLMVHYRQPLNWSKDLAQQAQNIWKKITPHLPQSAIPPSPADPSFLSALQKDLNTPLALRILLHNLKTTQSQELLVTHCSLLGLPTTYQPKQTLSHEAIQQLINERLDARKHKNFARSDAIRDTLAKHNITVHDHTNGTCSWSYHD